MLIECSVELLWYQSVLLVGYPGILFHSKKFRSVPFFLQCVVAYLFGFVLAFVGSSIWCPYGWGYLVETSAVSACFPTTMYCVAVMVAKLWKRSRWS
ncbi:hypothetical protein [Cupriavidus sp. 2SB]|uniref:hypothetical protein n=1 Tax=Cupriavidus sp. 2SB TaxID=2502199 RepID=UPI0010F7E179|nr:hypothetical protein [Cupriavidus sp. 2SB]